MLHNLSFITHKILFILKFYPTDVCRPQDNLTWHSQPVRLLNIFQTMYYLPLHNKVNSNAIRNSFLDDKHLHKHNTAPLTLNSMTL